MLALMELPQIPTCALDEAGVRAQRARYARLAGDSERVGREGDALVVAFRPGYDRDLLDEALAVERECCPFFAFALEGRSLRITVRDAAQRPALDALAHAFGATH